ncbi:MAG: hypothetical protein KME25_27555 [Symplocastrum torsivum CPER-KK1]|jgi:hypothetical protein|uniref:Uncharacterized protein n=1 Tax=Symplocastrum torsivum CPER-KK1 TaxID=450513 RepID=A0A951PQQ3_9CYAN|nr:hypothetical protein [Symplocastrum torsivum CPER-KK1]
MPLLVENVSAFNAGKENIAKLENAALKYLERSEVDEKLNTLAKILIERSTTL